MDITDIFLEELDKEEIIIAKKNKIDSLYDNPSEVNVILSFETEIGNNCVFHCEFMAVYPEELVVKGPIGSIPEGTIIDAQVTLIYKEKKTRIVVSGTVNDIEYDECSQKDILAIEITQIDNNDYDMFMGKYQERQKDISDFMAEATGKNL